MPSETQLVMSRIRCGLGTAGFMSIEALSLSGGSLTGRAFPGLLFFISS